MKIIKKFLSVGLALSTLIFSCQIRSVFSKDYISDLRWDFICDANGFNPDGKTTFVGMQEGTLTVRNNADDPNISTAVSFDINDYKTIRVCMKNNSESELIQFYLFVEGGGHYWIDKKVKKGSESSDFEEYVLPLSELRSDKEGRSTKCKNLRFDYINKTSVSIVGSVEIDYIVLSQYDEPLDDRMVENVTLNGIMLDEFKSDNEYYEVDMYDNIYSELNSENIIVEFGDAFSDASAYIDISEQGNKKVVDIDAVSVDGLYTRTYRIVCSPMPQPTGLYISKIEIDGDNVITFEGILTDDEGNALSGERLPITVLAYRQGYEIEPDNIKYFKTVKADRNGLFSGVIKMFDDESQAQYYKVELIFDVMGIEDDVPQTVVLEKSYINKKAISDNIEILKKSVEPIVEFMSDDMNAEVYDKVGIWIDLYKNQIDEVKTKINNYAEDYRSLITVETAPSIVNGSILAAVIFDMEASEASELLEELDIDMIPIEANGKRFKDLDRESQKWVTENIITNIDTLESWQDMYKTAAESMLLNMINNTDYMLLCDLLLDSTDILGNDLKRLKNETNSKIIQEAMRIIVLRADTKKFTAVDELLKELDSALDTAEKRISDVGSDDPIKNKGNGGGGGSSYAVASDKTQANENKNTEKEFEDLTGYEWAKEAILVLGQKGIVSGVGNNRYEPGRSVTREEFVKLICEAFGFEKGDTKSVFVDVKPDDWFAPYVACAAELGIVEGMSENMFGSGNVITREDMAAMIYRTIIMHGEVMTERTDNFEDSYDISEYANEAVEKLSAAGIINGVGSNMFAPKATATRAETAVIIFRCMEKFML